jgi:ATP-dependent 26S proteasome regulatory subunit
MTGDDDPATDGGTADATAGETDSTSEEAGAADVEPYADSAAYLADELRRVDLLLRRRVAAVRAGDPGQNRGGGLYVADEEVDRLLAPEAATTPAKAPLDERIDAVTERVAARRERTLEAGTELRAVTLAERFDLSPREVDALLVSLAPELDRKYERVYAYLQDDITQTRPSVGLVLDVLSEGERDRLAAREVFARDAALVAGGLVSLSADGDAPLLAHRVTTDQRVVGYLLGRDGVDPRLADVLTAVDPDTAVADLPVDESTRERVERLAPAVAGDDAADGDATPDTRPLRYVHGPPGVGRTAAVEAMCRLAGVPLVRAAAVDLVDAGVEDPFGRLVREARLRGGAVHVANVDALDGEGGSAAGAGVSADAVLRRLDRFDGPLFLTGEDSWSGRPALAGHEFVAVHLPRPGYERRRDLWERRSDALPAGVDPPDLAATFRLTAGAMDDAIAAARAFGDAGGGGDDPGEGDGGDDAEDADATGDGDAEDGGASGGGAAFTAEALYRGCRVQSRETLGALARRTDTVYDWEDIVLPADTEAQLREVAAHIKHRGTVYSDWGFDERFSDGTGMNVLFSGPSGTGKTMAAEIIAADAGLDMFKVDLATVVSKYIGETEENLKEIFDEAEHTDAVLFFDEADALFGERSEVSDSQDRYANVEVSYLLQRMEDHDGAVILASNFKENIDDAFLRRINANVEFPRPDREARAEIWRSVFPAAAPVGELDIAFLSGFEITGGNIKNVALTASFLAADDGESDAVEMEHVVRALRRELQKTGRLVNPEEFGAYRDLVG